MSEPADRTSPNEIVIVRRRSGGHDDAHHGGAWKIAFADFMTALMCFFLVMWLINASDKKTITQIAAYFNPLRLNDRLATEKGLDDPDNSPSAREATGRKAGLKEQNELKQLMDQKEKKDQKKSKDGKSDAGADMKKTPAARPKSKEAAAAERLLEAEMDLIRDPYRVIEQVLANDLRSSPMISSGSNDSPGMPRDLLDPYSGPRPPLQAMSTIGSAPQSGSDALPRVQPGTPGAAGSKVPPATGGKGQDEPSVGGLKAEIEKSMADLGGAARLSVEVSDAGNEVLVSITDDAEDMMFSIGSSQPTPELVRVMEGIGKVLAVKGGKIVVRGHTDARPYNAAGFDNWRLSTARAHTAYHLLMRAGLAADRILRIEGYSDRMLRVPTEPMSPKNRRIEMLVAKSKT